MVSIRITSVGPDPTPGSTGPTGSHRSPADSNRPGRPPRAQTVPTTEAVVEGPEATPDATVSLAIPHEELCTSVARVRLETGTGVQVDRPPALVTTVPPATCSRASGCPVVEMVSESGTGARWPRIRPAVHVPPAVGTGGERGEVEVL